MWPGRSQAAWQLREKGSWGDREGLTGRWVGGDDTGGTGAGEEVGTALTCTGLQTTGGEVHKAGQATASGAVPVATAAGHGARRPGAPLPTRTWSGSPGHCGPYLPHPPQPSPPPRPLPSRTYTITTHLRRPHSSLAWSRAGLHGGPLLGNDSQGSLGTSSWHLLR